MKTEVFIHRNPGRNSYDIFIQQIDNNNNLRHVAKPINLEFEQVDLGLVIEPTLTMSSVIGSDFLKGFAEALKYMDFKINDDNNGEIKRMENHLEDMRNIVYSKLMIDK